MCESVAMETPSQTTSTARLTRRARSRCSAMASSLRACRLPMSQTPPTQAAGVSTKWLRGSGGGRAAVVAVAVDDLALAGRPGSTSSAVRAAAPVEASRATGPVQPTSSGDSSPAGAVCGVAGGHHRRRMPLGSRRRSPPTPPSWVPGRLHRPRRGWLRSLAAAARRGAGRTWRGRGRRPRRVDVAGFARAAAVPGVAWRCGGLGCGGRRGRPRGGVGHQMLQGRTALASSTSATRSSVSGVRLRELPQGLLEAEAQARLGGPVGAEVDVGLVAVLDGTSSSASR